MINFQTDSFIWLINETLTSVTHQFRVALGIMEMNWYFTVPELQNLYLAFGCSLVSYPRYPPLSIFKGVLPFCRGYCQSILSPADRVEFALCVCVCVYIYIYIYIYIYNWLMGLVGRVFANGPGDLGSILDRVIPKTLKMVLDTSLLNTQQYKVRIKGKVEHSRERSNPPYTSV